MVRTAKFYGQDTIPDANHTELYLFLYPLRLLNRKVVVGFPTLVHLQIEEKGTKEE